MNKTPRSIRIARAIVDAFGSQTETAKAVGLKQPSVNRWLKKGISRQRENDLRILFPELAVWQKFPPQKKAIAD